MLDVHGDGIALGAEANCAMSVYNVKTIPLSCELRKAKSRQSSTGLAQEKRCYSSDSVFNKMDGLVYSISSQGFTHAKQI